MNLRFNRCLIKLYSDAITCALTFHLHMYSVYPNIVYIIHSRWLYKQLVRWINLIRKQENWIILPRGMRCKRKELTRCNKWITKYAQHDIISISYNFCNDFWLLLCCEIWWLRMWSVAFLEHSHVISNILRQQACSQLRIEWHLFETTVW